MFEIIKTDMSGNKTILAVMEDEWLADSVTDFIRKKNPEWLVCLAENGKPCTYNLAHLNYGHLVDIGIEPARADRLTAMGEPPIETDGTYIYPAEMYEESWTVAQFVEETNQAPFDYQEGEWIV